MTPSPGVAARAPFPREFLAGSVDEAAIRLLGAWLVRDGPGGPRSGRIVEVEAYGGAEDLASHARFQGSARHASMAAAPGHAYVYRVYGMHTCLNVVAGPVGSPAAVLVRAVAPVEGIESIRAVRAHGARDPGRIARLPADRLAAGPALVAGSFSVDRSFDGTDLCALDASLRLEMELGTHRHAPAIASTPRIGVAYAGEPWASLPRRFVLIGEGAVSRPLPRPGA